MFFFSMQQLYRLILTDVSNNIFLCSAGFWLLFDMLYCIAALILLKVELYSSVYVDWLLVYSSIHSVWGLLLSLGTRYWIVTAQYSATWLFLRDDVLTDYKWPSRLKECMNQEKQVPGRWECPRWKWCLYKSMLHSSWKNIFTMFSHNRIFCQSYSGKSEAWEHHHLAEVGS